MGVTSNPPDVLGIIPARYGSSRLPGKPLLSIGGKPMIQRVYEQCAKAKVLGRVFVATDDARIVEAVEGFGGKAVLTRVDHASGTDRIAEAASGANADIIVNIQGDQPFIDPTMIEEAVRPLLDDPSLELSTLMYRLPDGEDLHNPSVVKVVTDLAGNALYFSRSLIPYPREAVPHGIFEHVGTYVYRHEALKRITQLAPTTLERVESLEQLRWLEHGMRIRVVESRVEDREFSGFSVDTVGDLARAEEMLRERGLV
ncbi:MAG: 3-deoxy-manno-octulosonate cytidylyltransferase [Candidatus Hydrogenedentes bacterium]|nr:3-deoxy-manno-octulosonate cytidylyltransferase [Candidatus Hydrogenedentota bacterium]